MRPLQPRDRTGKSQQDLNYYDQNDKILSGNISFGCGAAVQAGTNPSIDNIKGTYISGTTPTIGTQFTLAHHLNTVPVGWLVIYKNGACDFYDSGTAWTKTNIYLKATAAGVKYTILVLG